MIAPAAPETNAGQVRPAAHLWVASGHSLRQPHCRRLALAGAAALALALGATGAAAQRAETVLDHFWRTSNLGDDSSQVILFFRADVDGDGHAEVFLSSECGNGGCAWQVYAPADGRSVRYLGEAGFHPSGYRVDARRHVLVYCWHMSARECGLGEYRVAGDHLVHRTLGTCFERRPACQRQLAAIRAWSRRRAPPLLHAPAGSLDDADAWRSEMQAAATRPPELDYVMLAARPNDGAR